MNTALQHPDPPIASFLARHNHANTRLVPLAGDASARRYFRLEGAGQLLMEDRSDPVGFSGFIRLSRHLRSLGLSAPKVFGSDPSVGLALIEDFGGATYSAQLADGRDETDLYALAIDTLLHLHHQPKAVKVSVPVFDNAILLDELTTFSEWFAPAINPSLDIVAFDRAFRLLWTRALAPLEGRHETLVLRDFHVDNLMELTERTGVQRCGLLDFQDGVLGPVEYDLVSLLQDARRDLGPGLETQMLNRYIASVPPSAGPKADILQRYYLLGAQRHARIAGVFLRLSLRDGKPGYLAFLPRVLRQFEMALEAANLHEISDFLRTTLPDWQAAGAALARTS